MVGTLLIALALLYPVGHRWKSDAEKAAVQQTVELMARNQRGGKVSLFDATDMTAGFRKLGMQPPPGDDFNYEIFSNAGDVLIRATANQKTVQSTGLLPSALPLTYEYSIQKGSGSWLALGKGGRGLISF